MEKTDLKFMHAQITTFLEMHERDTLPIEYFNDKINLICDYALLVHKAYKSVFTRMMLKDLETARGFFFRAYDLKAISITLLERVNDTIECRLKKLE